MSKTTNQILKISALRIFFTQKNLMFILFNMQIKFSDISCVEFDRLNFKTNPYSAEVRKNMQF